LGPLLLVLVLAVLQGLTEYLPVSSSGHLVLGKEFLPGGDQLSADASLEVLLHVGTLLAVLLFYRKRCGHLVAGFFGKGDDVIYQRRLAGQLVVATMPAVMVGFAIRNNLDGLFGSPYPVAMALMVTGCVLWYSKRFPIQGDSLRQLTWKSALIIGIFQAFAILPGISRSGTTIVVGLRLGLSPEAAAAFSFLLSIPAVLGASVLLLPELEATEGLDITTLGLAVGASFLVGWAALGLLVWITKRGKLHVFAPYCWAVGLAVLASSLF
jgi:undecaprenyl-diphosphatase